MAINDVAGGSVYHVGDILREFLGHLSLYIETKET